MSAEIRVFLGDDAERMCKKYEINPQEFMVNALQEELHIKAITARPWMDKEQSKIIECD
jgi:hypothetical protein